ncbi:hypothetical protein BRADI_2g36672v3 [Brachypodium distachyon]|uniref:F-box domain-containing protein n=1 Tax=Brachypodium distachyon TaxID=15368 RepID=A0A0Q3J4G1_BRADI|nr:hypothetical protein BRADI_2g36672v3 [Brachypodium distachyon]
MEHRDGGDIAASRSKLPNGGSEDRLSALHDDLLIYILLKLTTPAAVQTSVLCRRWSRLWNLLPELRFPPAPAIEPHTIRAALAAREEASTLREFVVGLRDASPESIAAWIPVAARRLSGRLVLSNILSQHESEEGGAWHLRLAVPPDGVFARLTDLCLTCVHLHGPCMLGEVVSSPRCPALRKLTVRDAYGLANLTIQSDSLIEMELENLWRYGDIGLGNFRIHSESLSRLSLINLQGLQELSVMAPALERLKVCSCFREVAETKASEFYKTLQSFSRPEICMTLGQTSHGPV